jgi:hypothetical protein
MQNRCTLQHYLDTTKAGECYRQYLKDKQEATEHENFAHNVWNPDSLGDLAYFYLRRTGEPPMRNGHIVSLVDGELVRAHTEAAMHVVISDSNVKWKGEPLPTSEQEKLGHWCAYLGQVRDLKAGEGGSWGTRDIVCVMGECRSKGTKLVEEERGDDVVERDILTPKYRPTASSLLSSFYFLHLLLTHNRVFPFSSGARAGRGEGGVRGSGWAKRRRIRAWGCSSDE